MSTLPLKDTPETQPTETVEHRFRRLEAEWTAAVGHLSSSTALRNHPAFREIIGIGPSVIPFMLRDLEERPRRWVWALPQITGADPVPAADQENIAKMSAAWRCWGKENGYEW